MAFSKKYWFNIKKGSKSFFLYCLLRGVVAVSSRVVGSGEKWAKCQPCDGHAITYQANIS